MKKPYVFYPSSNPGNSGDNHRAVTLRLHGQSFRIQCDTRKQADDIGRGLVGVFNRYIDQPNTEPEPEPQTP